jgi:hypothetical protein
MEALGVLWRNVFRGSLRASWALRFGFYDCLPLLIAWQSMGEVGSFVDEIEDDTYRGSSAGGGGVAEGD